MSGRERLHWLVDRLPEGQLAKADRVLTQLTTLPVRYTGWAKNDLDSRLSSPDDRQHVLDALNHFVASGMGDVRELRGEWRGYLRLRVGSWRVIFYYEEEGTVVIQRILYFREPAYRNA